MVSLIRLLQIILMTFCSEPKNKKVTEFGNLKKCSNLKIYSIVSQLRKTANISASFFPSREEFCESDFEAHFFDVQYTLVYMCIY